MNKEKKPIYKKLWFWLIVIVVVGGGFRALTGETNKETADNKTQITSSSSKTKTGSSTSSTSSASSEETIDENVVNNLKKYLTSGDMINFLKLYYSQDEKSSLNYYQQAQVATTKTTVEGQVVESNTNGTRLYIYVPVENMPNDVRNTKQNAYVVVAKDDNGSLKKYKIGDTAKVSGFLTSRGDKTLGYNWNLTVSN